MLCVTRVFANKKKNIEKGFPPTFSKLERLHNRPIPTQLNGIYALGVLAYKKTPNPLHRKFFEKAIPCIYLGIHRTIKGALLLPLNGSRVAISAVFTVNENYWPLKLTQVATAGTDFIKQHGCTEVQSLQIHYPAEEHNHDASLRDPRMDLPTPGPVQQPTRVPRERAPSAQALQNIASEADRQDRRAAAGTEGEVLVFSPIEPGLTPTEEEEPMLPRARRRLNGGALPFIPENSVFLTKSVPTTRHEYQRATPSTTRQADASQHSIFWSLARKREVISHHRNQTLGPLLDFPPPDYKVLNTSFVYKNKYVGDDAIMPEDLPDTDWKARMVVKGYLMIEGSDYHDTFAPTASPTSIRLICALAARLRYPIKAADFETAFLNSDMDTVVYVSTPSGYEA